MAYSLHSHANKMKNRIMIVDDEPLICFHLSQALRCFCDFHGDVKTFANGRDAIKEMRRCFYAICFLDIYLPDLNGLDVMKEINEISPETHILVMTAGSVTDEMKMTIEGGASLFTSKPLDLFQIRAYMKQVLEKGSCRN